MKTGLAFPLGRRQALIWKYPVKHFDELQYAHVETSFLAQFARHTRLQRFSELQCATRNGPFPSQRLTAAANEQSTPVFNNHAANTDNRTFRIFSRGSHFRNLPGSGLQSKQPPHAFELT